MKYVQNSLLIDLMNLLNLSTCSRPGYVLGVGTRVTGYIRSLHSQSSHSVVKCRLSHKANNIMTKSDKCHDKNKDGIMW